MNLKFGESTFLHKISKEGISKAIFLTITSFIVVWFALCAYYYTYFYPKYETRIILVLPISLFALLLAVLCVFGIATKSYKTKLPLILSLVMIVLVWVSCMFSIDRLNSVASVLERGEGLIPLCFYYLLFASALLVDKASRKKIIVFAFLLFTVVNGFVGAARFYDWGIYHKIGGLDGWNLIIGFVDHYNMYGSYTLLASGVCLGFLVFSDRLKARLLWGAMTLMSFWFMLCGGTRSAQFATAFMFVAGFCAIAIACKGERKKRFAMLGIGAVLFVGMFVFMDFTNGHYLMGKLIPALETIAENPLGDEVGTKRMYIWKRTLPLLKDYWLHGCGPSAFELAFPNTEANMDFLNGRVDKAHNEYLHTAVTLGIPAVLTQIGIFATVLTVAVKRWLNFKNKDTEDSANAPLYAGLTFAFFGYACSAFANISVLTVSPYYWIILGLLCGTEVPIFKKYIAKKTAGSAENVVSEVVAEDVPESVITE